MLRTPFLFGVAGFFAFVCAQSYAIPATPAVMVETNSIEITLRWKSVTEASGYNLYFAPAPYAGPEAVQHIDIGNLNEISGNLWPNAAFYFAVAAYDGL